MSVGEKVHSAKCLSDFETFVSGEVLGIEEMLPGLKVNDDLITDHGPTLETVEKNMRKLLKKLHGIKEVEFDYAYDLTLLFEKFSMLNISAVAKYANMNPGLLRQYVSGSKFPSKDQARKIESAIKSIGKELTKVSVYA